MPSAGLSGTAQGSGAPGHGLSPAFAVPPTPHPCPYRELSLCVTDAGILIKSAASKSDTTATTIRVGWGLKTHIEKVDNVIPKPDWSMTACDVYGIIGILKLYRTSYLIVIASRSVVGQLFGRDINTVRSVMAIPLELPAATLAVKALSAKNTIKSRMAPSASAGAIDPGDSSDATVATDDDDSGSFMEEVDEALKNVDLSTLQESKETDSILAPLIGTSASPNVPGPENAPGDEPSLPPSNSGGLASQPPAIRSFAQKLAFWKSRNGKIAPEAAQEGKVPLASDVMAPPVPSSKPESLAPPAVHIAEPASPIAVQRLNPTGTLRLSVSPANSSATSSPVLSSIALPASPAQPSPSPAATAEKLKKTELEARILKETLRLFSHEMYFAYDFDITASVQRKTTKLLERDKTNKLLGDLGAPLALSNPNGEDPQDMPLSPDPASHSATTSIEWSPTAEPHAYLPLWRRVDRRFWWNEELSQGFINAGLHDFILPIMQGFVQISSFPKPLSGTNATPVGSAFVSPDQELPPPLDSAQPAPSESSASKDSIQYAIISRRSRQRAGLRYQRRGIDEDANVANFVETEVVMSVERGQRSNVFSYVQIRGSIPLFWSQPGVHLKPIPKLDRTASESMHAMKKHFERTVRVYGPNTIVNLAEVTGKEAAVTNAFKEQVGELSRDDVGYQEFDFHHECKGMKYENISKLITTLEKTFASQGYFWASGPDVLSLQNGVYRVNCIDCLDRTNVVESAFAKHVLDKQMQACALIPSLTEKRMIDMIFNDVWANNGDAISRAYAGTSALKGDYTRTGKRDLGGMLNDGMNSLARMYLSTFSDAFSQSVIDYVLSARSLAVFAEFTQSTATGAGGGTGGGMGMGATDPRELFRLGKIRSLAIETCVALVLEEGEELKRDGGWTLLSPVQAGVRVAEMFEEKVLLLTSEAVYIVSYDYALEKVRSSTRVPLGNIVSIQKGAYILSPLQEAGRDPSQNYGFLLSYRRRPLALNKNLKQDTGEEGEVITRVTSYSVHNISSSSPSSSYDSTGFEVAEITSADPLSSMTTATDTGNSNSAIQGESKPPLITRRSLSQLLTLPSLPASAALGGASSSTQKRGEEVVSVAFKALPVEHTSVSLQQDSPQLSVIDGAGTTTTTFKGRDLNSGDPDSGNPGPSEFGRKGPRGARTERLTLTCRDVVDGICDALAGACADIHPSSISPSHMHVAHSPSNHMVPKGVEVIERDVVGLAEAQHSTPVFAKAEYALKRLLWLGG